MVIVGGKWLFGYTYGVHNAVPESQILEQVYPVLYFGFVLCKNSSFDVRTLSTYIPNWNVHKWCMKWHLASANFGGRNMHFQFLSALHTLR